MDWVQQGKIYTLKLSPGNYSLRVLAITAGNNGKYSPYVVFVIKEPSKFAVLILSIVLPLFVMVSEEPASFLTAMKNRLIVFRFNLFHGCFQFDSSEYITSNDFRVC